MKNRDIDSLLREPREQLSDWRSEYRALVGSCALAVRHDRCAVRLTGDRAVEMLNGLVTQQLQGLVGSGRHALLLTAKGRVLSDLRVLPQAEGLLLDVPRSGLANLLAAFKKYLPPLYARYEDMSDALILTGIYGPRAAEAVGAALGVEVPGGHLGIRTDETGGDNVTLIRERRLAVDGVEFLGARERAPALAERLLEAARQLGGELAGSRAVDVVRVESGRPEYGVDIDESNLAQETGLEAEAISYEKGCYLGQEVVARIHFRGHVNRRLSSLSFLESPGHRGAQLFDGDKEVGVVTSAVESPEYGAIGLGYVRREVAPSQRLRWSSPSAHGGVEVRESPFRSPAV